VSVDVHLGDEQGLDRSRRYLRPVARLRLPEEPDVVHLAMYEWLPSFEAWATGPAICGRSTSQGPLPEGTEVTCTSCQAYEPKYQMALDLQAGMSRKPEPDLVVQGQLHEHVRTAVRDAGLKQKWIADRLHVSEKHLSQILTGRVEMKLEWAERIVALCGMELVVSIRPRPGVGR
jgi:ribosome-binding protein aMBF1 (putative translation factor)